MRETQVSPTLDLSDAPEAKLPRNLRPMLATVAPAPFRKEGWIFEIKWDGYRAISEISGSNVRIQSRNGNSLDKRFPAIAPQLAKLGHDAVLDGEIVVLDPQGVAQFEWLQDYPRYGGQLAYYIFDILHLNGHDLTGLPLLRRKQLLKQIIPAGSSHLRYCDHIVTEGELFFQAITQQGVEGMIAKDAASRYLAGRRSKSWLKIKCLSRQEAVIAGYKESESSHQELGSLVLGMLQDETLVHIGEVGTGFSEAAARSIMEQLKPLIQQPCPFPRKPKILGRVHWVKPILQCAVKFQSRTIEGRLRQPVWLGLLEAKSAPEPEPPRELAPKKKTIKQRSETVSIDGHAVSLTNLDKLYWPQEQLAKRDFIAYCREVAPFILPHLRDRPLSLHRHPDGVEHEGFFQKDVTKAPDWVQTTAIASGSRTNPIHYVLCQDEATLVYLANLGCIELHPWHSRVSSLDQPDYLVIDLDPDDVPFSQVIEAALTVREIMDQVGGACWCKTSGMSGLHIVVPLGARYDYQQAVQFAQLVARVTHARLPNTTSLNRMPSARRQRIYVDFLQNRRGQTIATVYGARIHPNARVSAPLQWSEVKKNLDPTAFTIRSLGKRLDKYGDLWSGVLGPGIDMLACLNRLARMLK